MAKKSVSARRNSRRHSAREDRGSYFEELISSPAVRFVAGGIAAAILARIAQNLSNDYPQISNFIQENIDGIEGRLDKIRTGEMH